MNYLCQNCHKLCRNYLDLKTNFFKIFMRGAVTVLNLFPMYVVQYEMIEFMDNEMDRTIYKFLL